MKPSYTYGSETQNSFLWAQAGGTKIYLVPAHLYQVPTKNFNLRRVGVSRDSRVSTRVIVMDISPMSLLRRDGADLQRGQHRILSHSAVGGIRARDRD